jgi:aldehyde dehydrogenase (NAD+)
MVASIKPHRDELGLGDGRMLIGGDWVAAADEATWSHRHPATGEQVAAFPVATPADVDRAVTAARRAFDEGPWPRTRAGERVRVLHTIANLVREHADELLSLQALDNSVPLSFGEIYAMSSGTSSTTTPAGPTSWPARRCRRSRAATTWSSRCASRSAWWGR